MAFKSALHLAGHVFLRSILPFLGYPWRQAEAFFNAGTCCLHAAFSAKIHGALQSAGEVFQPSVQQLLHRAFSHCPVNNVQAES